MDDTVYSLSGKHILVTGASSGIGQACARRISKSGGIVSLVARNKERLSETLQSLESYGEIYSYDLSDTDGIENLISEITAKQGRLDGLMYCAGDCLRAPLGMCKPAVLQKSMQVNYFAFVEVLRCASKNKNSNAGASFVAMSSASSMKGERGLLGLSASKAAMNNAVRCAALELAPKKIRVNAIASAYVTGSRMVAETIDAFGEAKVKQNIAEFQPLGVGRPEDIADAAAFLLSDASRYMTGTIMMVDGGYMA